MTSEERLIAGALSAWNAAIERTSALFLPLSADELLQEIAPGKNRLIYLWGHLAAVNDRMLPLLALGERLNPEFDEPFLSKPDKTTEAPGADAIRSSWEAVNRRLKEGFESLSPQDWLQKHTAVSDEDFAREPHRNRFAVLLSRTGHIQYHLGQVALLRKSD